MSIESLLYFIDVSSNLNDAVLVGSVSLAIISLISFMVSCMAKSDGDDKVSNDAWRVFKLSLKSFFVLCFFCIVIPSQKTMYAIAFAHYSKQSDIPAKVLQVIEIKLDDIIKQKEKL